jgi:hypothetical protein
MFHQNGDFPSYGNKPSPHRDHRQPIRPTHRLLRTGIGTLIFAAAFCLQSARLQDKKEAQQS